MTPPRLAAPPRAALALAALLHAALPARAELALGDPPPSDPDVVTGSLENGLRYFIRQNALPEKRVELRLALRVGSVQETDEENGIAHFCEHMSFNGSKHFKAGDLVRYLESIGSRFGADSNAYTNRDETVYFLQVPTDVPGALDQALVILSDWAGRATLMAEDIDAERGVVLEEMRLRKGAAKRIREKQDRLVFRGSRYADRDTIGLESVVTGASHEVVRGFYQRWYRPEITGLVVVGDIDPAAIETRIRELFSDLEPAVPRRDVPTWPVPGHVETLYSVESDPELTSSLVQLGFKRAPRPVRTVGDMREELVEALASVLLTLRLAERAQSPDPPFLRASAGGGKWAKTLDILSLGARARDGHVPEALRALVEELERARQHGFLPAELDRARATVLAGAEAQYNERTKRRSAAHAGEILSAFLEDVPVTSAETDWELAQQLVPDIGIEEVNAALRRASEPTSRVVLVQVPDKPGAVPTKDELRAIVEPEGGVAVTAYADLLAGRNLMAERPVPGRVVTVRGFPEIGVTEMRLANGLRLVIKPTDFRADQIQMSAFADGGTARLPAAARDAAARADTLAIESGLAEYTQPQLRKLLAGKVAGAAPGIGTFRRSFGGSSTPKDLETMLQLVHLYFTAPAFREDALQRMVDREVEAIQNALRSPGGVYGRARTEVAYDDNPMFRPTTVDEVRALRLPDLEREYRRAFSDASEWTFTFVGNVDLVAHVPLLETYLGSLPAASPRARAERRPVDHAALDIHFPAGHTVRMVAKGLEDQARSQLMIHAPTGLDPDEGFVLDAVADLLEIRLQEILREEKGGTYSVSVFADTLSPHPGWGAFTVSFGSSPESRTELMADVRGELLRLRHEPPTPGEVDKLKALRRTALEEGVKENGWWVGRLQAAYGLGRDPRTVLDVWGRIDRLSPRSLHAAARRWLDLDNTAEVFLVPETWGPARWLASAVAAAEES
jgi:zinc protease